MMNDGRVVLGVDPGTGRCGWSIIRFSHDSRNRKQIELLDCGCVETRANTPLPDRLELIANELEKVIKKYLPSQLAIEEIFFMKNVKTGISVAHARGVAMLVAKRAKLEIFEYKPNVIKLSVCGYGHATKDQMTKMVSLQVKNCNITQDDTIDAVAVALCHLGS
jgi:crossover junction endodeoxyribonuclease RuvC